MIDFKSNVIWAMSCVYAKNSNVFPHNHPFFHYLYVKRGSGFIKIGDEQLPLLREHVYMMKPGVMHEIIAGDEGLISYEIKFEVFDGDIVDSLLQMPESLALPAECVEVVFEQLFDEMANQMVYRKDIINIKFFELITQLRRQNENLTSVKRQVGIEFSDKFAAVIFYMDQHISERIRLDELAAIAHSEKTYFIKAFKKEMHTTPMNYLHNMRISKAKKLLLHSDMNVTQISSAVGFSTVHHFTNSFTSSVGVTPSAYKLSNGRI